MLGRWGGGVAWGVGGGNPQVQPMSCGHDRASQELAGAGVVESQCRHCVLSIWQHPVFELSLVNVTDPVPTGVGPTRAAELGCQLHIPQQPPCRG